MRDEINAVVQALANTLADEDAIEAGKETIDPQVSLDAAEAIVEWIGIYIAVLAVRGARPTPPPPAITLADMEELNS